MSAALDYRESYRFSAGILALVVHLVFFSLLYVSFRWQSQPPEEFMVEMWDSLPNPEVVPEPAPAPPAAAEPAPAPSPKAAAPVLPPVKPEIELREKKKKEKKAEAKEKLPKKVAAKEMQSRKDEAREKAAAKAKQEKERRELEEYVAKRVQAEQARIRAEVDAATKVQVERYQDMIRGKIRRKIVKQDVPDTVAAEFKVTLLPDGSVLDVVLLKGSGYKSYDDAAERAIYLAQPLPLPADEGLKKMFRELKLTIRP